MSNSFPGKGGKLFAIYGADPAEMAKQLMTAAGVIEAIPAGARISLKPNLVVGRPAAGGATTHPEILAGIIEWLFDHGRKEVDIIEGSWLGDDTGRAFAACGMNDLGKRYGVRLHDLKRDSATAVDTPAGKMHICDRALAADFLINLPVLKGHCQTRMTCVLKNMKGCITDAEKRRFHREGLDQCIAALATAIVPHVSIVDGICGDLDFEEGGTPVQADRMLLGADPVKLDSYASTLMGLAPTQVGYLPLAAEYGVGEMGWEESDLVELNRPVIASAGRASGKMQSLGKYAKADQACSACYANLIHALKRLEERGGLRQPPPIHIGQGWKGKELQGVGIGLCCRKAAKNIPGCPPTALAIAEALAGA
ncbi:MAG: DUF362 domain-containing protein [Planctomycetes bacterium]|nr:DUF362 domain-containing protein [Planctomycetota bacterium]